MDWPTELATQSQALNDFRKAHPDAARGFTALSRGTMAEGSVTCREKELIALGIAIATRCVDCIGYHVQSAAKAGATRDDVAQTVGVATMMGGGPAYMYGVKALTAWDQLVAPASAQEPDQGS